MSSLILTVPGRESGFVAVPFVEVKNFLSTLNDVKNNSTLVSLSLRWWLITDYKASHKSVNYQRIITKDNNLFCVLDKTIGSTEIVERKPGNVAISFVNNTFIVGFLED